MKIANEFCETTINRQLKTKAVQNYQPQIDKSDELKANSSKEFKVSAINKYSIHNEFIFNLVELEPKGFIVLSNNKSIEPIIAYSMNSDFQYDTVKSNILLQLLINDLSNREKRNNIDDEWSGANQQSDDYIFRQWPSEGTTSTGGWVETTWDQYDPINRQAPFLSECNQRAPIGCSPLAVAQIVNYHKYLGNWNFKFDSYGNDYFSSTYDVPTYDEQYDLYNQLKYKYDHNLTINEDDIGTLGRISAMASYTNFECWGSSTWEGNEALAFIDSINGLGYYRTIFNDFHNRATFGQIEVWDSITTANLIEQGYPDNFYFYCDLKENMINRLPAILGIKTGDLEHTVVCDGYNTDGFFHLNYGWGPNSPAAISDIWYKIPYVLNDGHLFSFLAYDIMPYAIPDYIQEEMILLYSREPLNTKRVIMSSYDKEITVSHVYSTYGYCEFSLDSINFSPSLSNFSIGANDTVNLYVRSANYDDDRLIDNMIVELDQRSELVEIVLLKIPETATIIEQKTISGKWTNEMSPIFLFSDCRIRENDSLIVSEGVTIISHNTEIVVPSSSVIKAYGTRESPIIFKPLDNTCIFPGSGWLGITFEFGNYNDNLFEFCSFYDAKTTQKESYGQLGTIAAYYSNVSFDNCKFVNCWTPVIATGSNIAISNCLFKDNLYGYIATDITANSFSNVDIYNSIFIKSPDFQNDNRFFPPYEYNQYFAKASELLRKSFHIGASKVNIYNSDFFGSDFIDMSGTDVEVKIVNSCLIDSRIQSLNNCNLEIRNNYSNFTLEEIISPDLVDKCESFISEENYFGSDSISLYEVPNVGIDAGYNWLSDSSLTDFIGRARIWDGNNDGIANIDIGAFEYNSVYKRYYETCDNNVLEINGRAIENSGQYIDTLIGYNDRDSIIYSYVDIMSSFDTTNFISFCEGENYNGWTTSGEYIENFVTICGCDSIIRTILEVKSKPISPVINIEVDSLFSNFINMNGHQWYLNDIIIPGATNYYYKATLEGLYHVIYTDSSLCTSDLSNTIEIFFNSVNNNQELLSTIFPNPCRNEITVHFVNSGYYSFELINIYGQVMCKGKINGIKSQISVESLSEGIYFLRVSSKDNNELIKIVKQK